MLTPHNPPSRLPPRLARCALAICALALGAGSASMAIPARAEPAAAVAPALDRARVERALRKLAGEVTSAGGELGAAVVWADSGELLVAHRGDAPLNPASNAKLFTAWAALAHLGPEHRYLTGLYGRVRAGRVAALIVRGEGDPSLEMGHLFELAARLRRAGVSSIGDIVVDQSYFDGRYTPPAFEQQPDEWASFRAPVAALSLAGNTVLVEVRAGRAGEPASVAAVPSGIIRFEGQVRTSRRGAAEAVQLSLAPASDGTLLGRLGGSLPEGSPTLSIYKRVDDPTLLAGHGLADACRQLGIEVQGRVREGRRQGEPLLAAHRSEPLPALLLAVGKHSNNYYAEMIFKRLGAGAKPASFEAASARVGELLAAAGLAGDGLVLRNGSGLFDANRVSAQATARLLAAAYRDPAVGPELMAQLAIGGVDGTLRHRFRAHRKSRAVRAKTGTLAAVSALSGYLLIDPERPLAFSLLVNGARGQTVAMRLKMDAFVEELAQAMRGTR